MLGSSGPGADSQESGRTRVTLTSEVEKANLLSRSRNARSDTCCMSLAGSSRPLHAARLQCPKSTLSPAMGATCGRREREAGAGNGRSNPFHVPALATVEGTLVHATSSTFAGGRNNVSLGRSGTCALGLVPTHAVAPMTTGALWKKEEGNVVSMREAHALDAPMPNKHRHAFEHTSFTRSRDPCTSIGTQLSRRQLLGGVAAVEVSRSGKPAQAGGTGTGAMIARTNARLAACHRSRKGGRA